MNAAKLFIQPSISYTNRSGTLQAAIASRFSSVTLNIKRSTATSNSNFDDFQQVQDIKNNGSNIYWEPSIVLKGGSSKVKAHLQYTASTAFNKRVYLTQPAVVSIGVMFSFNATSSK